MATLTTSYQLLAEKYLGTSGGSLYVRLYAKYKERDIPNNRTKVKYKAIAYYTGGSYIYDAQGNGSVSGTGVSTASGSATRINAGEQDVASAEGWVTHNSDGKKSVSCSAKLNFPNWGWSATASASADLPTIPRASTVSCSSPYIGDTAIITIGRKSSSFTHTVSYHVLDYGTLTDTIAEKTKETVLSFDTSTLKEQIYALMPKAKSIAATIRCRTFSGDTKIGDTAIANFKLYANEEDCKPDIDGTVIDTNETTIAITGDSSKFIKYLSKPKVTIDATSKYSSSISSYLINLNDGQTSEKKENTFGKIESDKITIKTTDSRGYSNSKVLTLEMIDYIKLHIDSIDISRTEDMASEVILNANGVWFNDKLNDTLQNTLSASFQYKLSGGTEWIDGGTLTPTINGNTFKFTDVYLGNIFDYENEYQFKIIISDSLMTVGSETKEIIVLPKGQEVVAIGDDEVWVYGDLLVNDKKLLDLTYPVGSVYIGLDNTNPSLLFGGTWEQIKDTFLLSAGDNYKVGSTGGEASHKLTVEEMPSHDHTVYNTNTGGSTLSTMTVTAGEKKGYGWNVVTSSSGGGQAHNNMPPYLTVYMWKRIS